MHAPLAPVLRTEWLAGDGLAAIADEWRDLARRAAEPNAFHEPGVLLHAIPVFGPEVGALAIRNSYGRLMGLFPMRPARHRNGPGRTAFVFTHAWAPFGVPLVDRDAAQAVTGAWLDHLARTPGQPALLMIPYLTTTGAFAAALDRALAERGLRHADFGCHERAELAPGDGRDGYIQRAVGAKKRKELRRQRNRLEDSGRVTFVTVGDPCDVAPALQDFFALEASGWKGSAGTAAVSHPATQRFFESAILSLAAEGQVRIDSLKLDGRTIATCVTVTSGDTAWIWKIGYCESLAKLSPGVQLVIEFTEAFLATPEIARADSLAVAGHPMIDHIWRERRPMADRLIAVRRTAWPFALACRVEQGRRDARETAKRWRDRIRARLR